LSARILRSPWLRIAVMLVAFAGAAVALWWHGPSWAVVSDAFTIVRWRWVFVAIGLNLLSVLARSLAWRTVINQAVEPPQPKFRLVFAAFSVGLFANAVLPGRIGELARVAVLTRRMPGRQSCRGCQLAGSRARSSRVAAVTARRRMPGQGTLAAKWGELWYDHCQAPTVRVGGER